MKLDEEEVRRSLISLSTDLTLSRALCSASISKRTEKSRRFSSSELESSDFCCKGERQEKAACLLYHQKKLLLGLRSLRSSGGTSTHLLVIYTEFMGQSKVLCWRNVIYLLQSTFYTGIPRLTSYSA